MIAFAILYKAATAKIFINAAFKIMKLNQVKYKRGKKSIRKTKEVTSKTLGEVSQIFGQEKQVPVGKAMRP